MIDDAGIPPRGRHSVSVVRQSCDQFGKQENCQAAVSLSVVTRAANPPVGWRPYLPEEWTRDWKRRCRAGGSQHAGNLRLRHALSLQSEPFHMVPFQRIEIPPLAAGITHTLVNAETTEM